MGMTIDEAIVWLNTDDFESKGFADATSVAIDTMREYQKIQEIVAKWKVDSWTDNLSYECMIEIAEIIDKFESEGKNDRE
jgi:hypothetical protein